MGQAELPREASQFVDVQVELGKEHEFVLGSLQTINVVNLILAEFNKLEHLAVGKTLQLLYSVEGQVESAKFRHGCQTFYDLDLVVLDT